MTKYILISILTLYGFEVDSQGFAPIGAEWYYCEGEVFAPQGYEDYLKVSVIQDTVVQGKLCREIKCDWLCGHPGGKQYVYSNGDSVFLFDPLLFDFKLIYDFGAISGDRIVIPIKDYEDGVVDTVILTIDSVGTIEVNNIELNHQFVTYYIIDSFPGGHQNYSYSSQIIEIIGDVYFIFGFPEHASLICDANYSCGLRCYDDSLLGHYETGIAPECTYTYVNVKEPEVNSLHLFPNPTNGKIFFEVDLQRLYSIDAVDVTGKICRKFVDLSDISLEGLPNGVYFLMITDSKGKLYVEKVLMYGS